MIEALLHDYRVKRAAINARLNEFAQIQKSGDDSRYFEELVFCIFTAGASARMGLRSVDRVGPYLRSASHCQLASALAGAHRYPTSRSGYIVHTRRYLRNDCGLRLRERLESFGANRDSRRDFLAANPGIKGVGYKEASHFLRNIGYRGYAILDKHILRTLYEFGVIGSPDPPASKKNYLVIEELMRKFAQETRINFDELDLLLWSNKTGEILK